MQQKGAQVAFRHTGLVYNRDGQAVRACADVDFTVPAGCSAAVIGPSGCGKSSLLLMAAGLLEPTDGEVLVNGHPLAGPRRETAFIPQDLGLFPWKTVLQNAMAGLRFHGMPKAAAAQRAREALEAVGLEGFERAYPKDLSGGMRQRLALARGLAIDADLLLMDEPLSAIDALLREDLQDMLLDFWRRSARTQVLVTHSIEEAVYLGQVIVVFSDRPATVACCLDNPRVGTPDWRDSDGFAAQCRAVREALARAVDR